MSEPVEVVGVYPVAEAAEPCHLIEVLVTTDSDAVDFGAFKQPLPGRPESDWQVAYDEVVLNREGSAGEPVSPQTTLVRTTRAAFFLHYLDLNSPLATPLGAVQLPPPTPRPPRLTFIRYESPC